MTTTKGASIINRVLKQHKAGTPAEATATEGAAAAAPGPAPAPTPAPAPAPDSGKPRRGSIRLIGQLTGWQRGKRKEGAPQEKKMQEILISVPIKVLDVFKSNVAGSRSAVIAALVASAVDRIERGEDIELRAEDLKHWFE